MGKRKVQDGPDETWNQDVSDSSNYLLKVFQANFFGLNNFVHLIPYCKLHNFYVLKTSNGAVSRKFFGPSYFVTALESLK